MLNKSIAARWSTLTSAAASMRKLARAAQALPVCAKEVAEGINNNARVEQDSEELFACAAFRIADLVVMPPTRNPSRKSRSCKVQPRHVARNCCLHEERAAHSKKRRRSEHVRALDARDRAIVTSKEQDGTWRPNDEPRWRDRRLEFCP